MPVVAAIALMVYCLDRKKDFLAGLCWAVVVIKPQDGFLLALPLVLARKWKTIFTAASITLCAACIASFMCNKPTLDLVMEVPKLKPLGVTVPMLPDVLTSKLVASGTPANVLPFANMVVGVVICCWLSFLVRNVESWFVRFLPAVAFAGLWTFMDACDRCIFFVGQVVFWGLLVKSGNARMKAACALLMVMAFCAGLAPLGICQGVINQIGRIWGAADFYDTVEPFIQTVGTVGFYAFVAGVVVLCILEARSRLLSRSLQ